MVLTKGHWFEINFVNNPRKTKDIISFRFDLLRKVIYAKSFLNDQLRIYNSSEEIKINPLKNGDNFQLEYEIEGTDFKISIDGKFLNTYRLHLPLEEINYINFNGAVNLVTVSSHSKYEQNTG